MPRTGGCDLSWDKASELFDSVITTADLVPRKLFYYNKSSPADWKKRIAWADVRKNRYALTLVLEASEGLQLRHRVLVSQLATWLQHRGLSWSLTDVERCCYGLRNTLAHVRDFARDYRRVLRKLPKGYESMQTLLDNVAVSPRQEQRWRQGF